MSRLRAAALAVGCAAAALTLTATTAHAAPGDTQNVCSSQLTPTGWVDVQWWNDISCSSTFSPNKKQIKDIAGLPIGTTLTVCSSTYQPAGWVQLSSFYNSSCRYSAVPSLNNNAWQIKRVS
ncbi:hypothetical protein ABTX81_27795 [Kitasatospora sp. NPDC097605]|uniref:hypothetical protein n=1 Tax=Kitasatospora sp. NPDC097605 TaxID=3157226 RepID=UPI0033254B27